MNFVNVFVAEIVVCLAVSAFVVWRLQQLLRRVGVESCEQGGRSTDFWVAYTQLMMFIAPALLVAWFSQAGRYFVVVDQMKSSLGLVLLGQFIGLALVGRAVWNVMAKPASPKEAV